jgi:hypothetical protein
MVFEVCNSMKMNLCIGFGDGVGLLLQMSWLLKEECTSHCGSLDGGRKSLKGRMHITLWKFGWRKEKLKGYKKKSSGLQGQLSFLNCS